MRAIKSCDYLLDQSYWTNYDIEFSDVAARFANDVIASSAFGLKLNSFEDRTYGYFETGQTAQGMASTTSLGGRIVPQIVAVAD